MSDRGVKDVLRETIGFLPNDPVSWLYASRGLYKLKEYRLCIEAVSNCLRSEKTLKDAQHILAFCLWQTGQHSAAAGAFVKSVKMGNETDWQVLIALFLDHPNLRMGN